MRSNQGKMNQKEDYSYNSSERIPNAINSTRDEKEKSKGVRRINKSKIVTNIVPSFLDEMLREIEERDDENEIIIQKETTLNNDSDSESANAVIEDIPSEDKTMHKEIPNNKKTTFENISIDKDKKTVSTSDNDIIVISQFPESSQAGAVISPPPIPEHQKTNSLQSIGTSPFRTPVVSNRNEKQQQQPKRNVTILYPKRSAQAQQRRQQEIELQTKVMNQKQQKAQNNQQLIIIEEQPSHLKSILKNPSNEKPIIDISKTINLPKSKPKANQAKNSAKNEQKTAYIPPVYEQKLSALFEVVSSESDEPFTNEKINFENSQAEMRDAFVFNVHEEGGRLYLFCKYVADPTQYGTICICIASPNLFLQFLPSFEMSDETVLKEVENIVKSCDGQIISSKWVNKLSINSTLERRYLEVEISSKCNMANIPIKGKTYEAVNGSSLSLTEIFLIKQNIKGARWISVRCAQAPRRLTSIPMYTALSPSDIVIEKDQLKKPSMNICIFSTFERNGTIFMISVRILFQCNYENLDIYKGLNSSRKSIITFIYVPEMKASTKNDRTTMYCNSESELLQNFVDRIEYFDIDILCSYDLINHDLPLILDRMNANNMKQWSKLSRHFRTVYPKKENLLPLITSGRLLLDLKSSFKNLLYIDSDSFPSLVMKELGIEIPVLRFDDENLISFSDQKQLQALININRNYTQFIKKILSERNIIGLIEHISRITGSQWSQIMSEPIPLAIESLLLSYLNKKNYIIPDKKQKIDNYIFEPFNFKPGFYTSSTALVSCDFLTAKIIQKNKLCFNTLNQLNSSSSNLIFPNLITELLNTLKEIIRRENAGSFSQSSAIQKSLFKSSLQIILNLIKPYFELGSQRFPIKSLGQLIDNEIHAFINYFGESLILTSGQNDYNFFVFECEKGEEDKSGLDQIKKYVLLANKHFKNFDIEVVNKFSRLLVLDKFSSDKSKVQPISFLGIDYDGEQKPNNFNFYRHDWCQATKILVDNALRIIMSSIDAENDLITLFNEFPDLSQLTPSDFEIATTPPNPSFYNKLKKRSSSNKRRVLSAEPFNKTKSVLSKNVISQQLNSRLLPTTDDDEDTELEDDEYPGIQLAAEDRERIEIDEQLIEIMKKFEEKGKFINIEGKINYVRCRDNVIKTAENVASIEEEIDLEWYKKNQFCDAMILILKPFEKYISLPQLVDSFIEKGSDKKLYDFNNFQLAFKCFNCNQKNIFTEVSHESFRCQNCGIKFNWKFVANSLTSCINNFVEKWCRNTLKCSYYLCKQKRDQILMSKFERHLSPCDPTCFCPGEFVCEFSSSDVYDCLLNFEDIFDIKTEKDEDDQEYLVYYMKNYLNRLKDIHSFTNLRLSSLLSTQPSSTQIINDVCSFLDDED